MIKKLIERYGLNELRKAKKEVFSLKASVTDWIKDIINKHNDQEERLREVEARLLRMEQERMRPYNGFF